MNDVILTNLNESIKENDVLYFLGDFIFGPNKPENAIKIRKEIKCKNIVGIRGNHDKPIWKPQILSCLYSEWDKRIERKIGSKFFVLDHFNLNTYENQGDGAIHLFGHSHGNLPDKEDALTLDVGVDTEWYGHKKYTPYHMDEILEIIKKKVFKPVDHHNGDTQ